MKNIELFYLLVAYGMGGLLARANKDGTFLTASNIAAGRKTSRQVFFWGLLISGLLFGALMYGWFIPHFMLSRLFGLLIAVLIGCQILTGIVPARGKRLNSLHLAFAFSLAVCMLAVVVWFVATPTINTSIRVLNLILAVGMLGLLISFKRVTPDKYLKSQWIFFSLWHMALFLTVYLG